MKYIQCPENMNWWDGTGSIFLAGGITGCPDWQTELKDKLFDTKLTLVNPRRENFGETDPKEQIKWEFHHLRMVDAISFWFPSETLCPITLFEYGKWLGGNRMLSRKLFVGCHPDYQRKLDLIVQTELENKEIQIVHSLEELAEQIKEWAKSRYLV